MKKILLFATAGLLFTGVAFGDSGKKKAKCAKGKTCSGEKSCKKDKANTAKL
jgi:hypothetical protein